MEDKGLELSQRKISRSDDVHYDFPDSLHLLESHGNKRHQNLRWRELLFCAIFGLSLVLSIAALSYSGSIDRRTERLRAQVFRREDGTVARHLGYTPLVRDKLVKRIAFGSCTSHHVDEQTIWTQGIIPSDPDAWIWLGDMAYLASAFVDCEDAPSNVEQCNCTPDWLHSPPKGCMAGDLDHAREKMRRQLLVAGYQKFLDFMCPGFLRHGMFPPLGADSEICPRPIIGTYDDNDFGMNNGNRRLPNKFEMKQIYLDGIGEARNSPRRSTAQGIQWKYTFNEGRREQLIDLYLLDERYERDTLPCHMRREWCERVLEDKNNEDFAWCTDFVVNGGLLGNGSCCTADDEFFKGWCVQEGSKDDPNWSVACDPTSSSFASKPLTLSFTQPGFPNGALAEIKESKWESVDEVSPFCEVLGPRQRQWLSQSLAESEAPLKLIASGSVVLGNPVHIGKKRKGHCSSDDWECYYPAQLQLLHTIGNMPKGCVVILTGDYHISDIKVLEAGTEKKYPKDYRTEGLSVPIYQVMASGMTNNTAKYHRDDKVCDKWRRDPAGFRPCGPCSFMAYPAFGFLEVDWDAREVHIQIRDGSDGTKVARGDDGSELSLSFSLDTCKPVAPPSCKGGK